MAFTEDVFHLMNIVGLLAFAITGSMKAIKEGLDLFGITVLGVMTALGGGITRDLLINTVPNALRSLSDMSIALLGVCIAIVLYKVSKSDLQNKYYILIPDAIGLSAFTTTGAIIAYSTDVSLFGIVMLATLTGIGGGLISDLLLGKVSFILRDDFYASCSILGAIGFYIAINSTENLNIASAVCAVVVFALRIMAIIYGWRLPRFS